VGRLAVAMIGVVLIARTVEGDAKRLCRRHRTPSALSWATGNLFLREMRAPSIFSATVWASLVPPIPLLLAGAVTDGWAATFAPILAPSWRGSFVLFYTVRAGDVARLLDLGNALRTYPAAKVGPVSLLVRAARWCSRRADRRAITGLRCSPSPSCWRCGARHLASRKRLS